VAAAAATEHAADDVVASHGWAGTLTLGQADEDEDHEEEEEEEEEEEVLLPLL
jgi:hypothetical protein